MELQKIIENIPVINILIFKDKIIYANKSTLQNLEYSKKELLSKSIEELVPEEYRKIVKSIKEKLLNGCQFDKELPDFPIITKNNNILRVYIFSKTITYNNSNAGLLIAFDNTEKYLLGKTINLIGGIYNLSNQLNKNRQSDKFLDEVCNSVSHYLNIFFSAVYEYTEKEKLILKNKTFTCEKLKIDKNCEEYIAKQILCNKAVSKLKENNIVTGSVNLMQLRSFCAIPVVFEGKLKYIFLFCSKYSNFMNKLNINLLNKIRDIITFTIEKIEKDKNILILYKALENSPDWVLITDINGKIIYANKTVERLTKYSKNELIGQTPSILKSGYYDKSFYDKMWSTLLAGESFSCVVLNKDKYGGLFKVEHLIIPVKIGNEITHFVALGKDLTREDKLEGEIFKLKFKDIVTGLVNRSGFIIELEKELSNIKKDEHGCILLIDIYNFSYINKLYSETVGDEILKDIGKLLLNISDNIVVGRVGGDEFAILKKIKKDEVIEQVSSLIDIFKISKFSSHEIVIGVNIGIAIYPDDAQSATLLLQNSRAALAIAKEKGENSFQFFNKDISDFILQKKGEKDLIVEAIENNYFKIYLQPYFYSKDKTLAGFEALLRIHHPERGVLTPYHFINTLEKTIYIFEVEEFLIDTIYKTLLNWGIKYKEIKPISINLTARSFKNDKIINFLIDKLKKMDKPYLNIELTERLFFEDFEYTVKVIEELHKVGSFISLDDFGTGYSSLSYLTDIPIDILKIDISFIRKMMIDKKAFAIVETIIDLAKKIEFKTIAEGVETDEQFNILKNIGCDIVQGYLFSKPLPIDEAEKFLV